MYKKGDFYARKKAYPFKNNAYNIFSNNYCWNCFYNLC